MLMSFIVGICLMSIFATIGVVISCNGKEWGMFFCGPVAWAAIAFAFCCRKIQHWVRFHNRRSLLVDENGDIFAVQPWAVDAYCEEKSMSLISLHSPRSCKEQELSYSIQNRTEEWGKYFFEDMKPNVRYAPKSVWKDFDVISHAKAKKTVSQYKEKVPQG